VSQTNKKWTAREVALEVLTKVDMSQSYSNLQLNQTLQRVNLNRSDVNFSTQLIYGVIQHLSLIDWLLTPFLKQSINKLEPWVRNILRMSIYQIQFLDRIPSHAVVNEAVSIANRRGHRGISGMVNAILRNFLRKKDQIKFPDDLTKMQRIALQHSHPEWMVERFIHGFGESETEEICGVNNRPPLHSIRINSLKITREEMITILQEEFQNATEILPSPLSRQGILVKGVGNLAFSEWYKKGYFTIQDASSMLVADVLDPKPGMTVLDAAAAPGGKTTHIAEKMEDKGLIIAADLHQHKLRLIEENQQRLGIHIIKMIHSDARHLTNPFSSQFDRILLDVPCSGLGVIRRKPDLKWSKSEEQIQNVTKVQREIIETVAPLLKPGGVMVYSTCTMSKEENEEMVKSFVKDHPEFQFDVNIQNYLPEVVTNKLDVSQGMVQILPHYFDTDGFFISRLLKKDQQ